MEVNREQPLLIRVKQACERVSLSAPTLYEAMNRGDLPYHRFGRARRIAVKDLEAFIARNRCAGHSEGAA